MLPLRGFSMGSLVVPSHQETTDSDVIPVTIDQQSTRIALYYH